MTDLPVIRAWVHFTAERAMNVVVEGPDGPFDAGLTRRTGDLGRIARDAARTAWRTEALDLQITVDNPPWLAKGTEVELAEPGAGATHPYARVVGFLPLGAILVRHPETGDAVCAPEDLICGVN